MKLDIRSGTIEEVLKVNVQIPEFDGRTTASKISTKLTGKAHLILVASHAEKPIAYKIGYEISDTEFYSWLGGVIPNYRKKGVATKLREKQESWALNHGYSTISVKSMNRYRAMLQLLISNGYYISGYEDNGCVASSKIKFIKHLNKIAE
ncbi:MULTISPECIES: GNAT family N-acetyltransferase [Idiomarina]|uniref:Acetyltransferase, GNAT family protein n=1 Tax=Idiomarina baltica OS145 TaxID=314276 RepID=A0ABM9WLN8_9GAMM|nr:MULTISPECIES: GNAT family N-acetyltransferase [Idiomarina]EAQ31728.1 acetyltransferase, GNAT family protein [Idiomarina baltica OS145]KXS34865.1 MAG: GNAT family acetyltransferase [Idiomarina sp. T82-3]